MPKTKTEFRHETVASKERFDPRSFRTKVLDGHRIVTGCPRGKWSPKTERCKVATEAQTILHPKDKAHRSNPICDIGETIAAADKWFNSPVAVIKNLKIPKVEGSVILAGELHRIEYKVPGEKGCHHIFKNASIIVKPNAKYFIVIGKFKFDPERGFVNT
ncbi:hypothetical protein ES702_07409 [subsurface metagenome]